MASTNFQNLMRQVYSSRIKFVYAAMCEIRKKYMKDVSALIKAGLVKRILELVRIRDNIDEQYRSKVMEISMSILGNLCMESIIRKEVLNERGIPCLVELYEESECVELLTRVCRCLSNMLYDPRSWKLVCCVLVMEKTVKLLNDSELEDSKLNYIRAIRLLGQTDSYVQKLCEQNAVGGVMKCYNDDSAKLNEAAFRCIHSLSSHRCCALFASQVITSRKLSSFLELVKERDFKSFQLIVRLCEHHSLRAELGNNGGIDILLEIVSTVAGLDEKWVFDSLSVLCLSCKEAVNRVKLREKDILPVFVGSLSDDRYTKLHPRIVSALVCFLYDDTSFEVLLECRLVPILIQLLRKFFDSTWDPDCSKYEMKEAIEAIKQDIQVTKDHTELVKIDGIEANPIDTGNTKDVDDVTVEDTMVLKQEEEPVPDEELDAEVELVLEDTSNMTEPKPTSKVEVGTESKPILEFENTSDITDPNATSELEDTSIITEFKPTSELIEDSSIITELKSTSEHEDASINECKPASTRPVYSIHSPTYQSSSTWNYYTDADENVTCISRFTPPPFPDSNNGTSYSPISNTSYYSPSEGSPGYNLSSPETSPDRRRNESQQFRRPTIPKYSSAVCQLYKPVTSPEPGNGNDSPSCSNNYDLDSVFQEYSVSPGGKSPMSSEFNDLPEDPTAFTYSPVHSDTETEFPNEDNDIVEESELVGTKKYEKTTDNENTDTENMGVELESKSDRRKEESIMADNEAIYVEEELKSHGRKTEGEITDNENDIVKESPSVGSKKYGKTADNEAMDVEIESKSHVRGKEGEMDIIKTSGCVAVVEIKNEKYSRSKKAAVGEDFDGTVKSSLASETVDVKPEMDLSQVFLELDKCEDNMNNKKRKRKSTGGTDRVTELNILTLLSRVSQMTDPTMHLVTKEVMHCLLDYISMINSPLSRCPRLLSRLFRNPLCFQTVILLHVPVRIYERILQDENLDSVVEHFKDEQRSTNTVQGSDRFSDRSSVHASKRRKTSSADQSFTYKGQDHKQEVDFCDPGSSAMAFLEDLSQVIDSDYGRGVIDRLLYNSATQGKRTDICISLIYITWSQASRQYLYNQRIILDMLTQIFGPLGDLNSHHFITTVNGLRLLFRIMNTRTKYQHSTILAKSSCHNNRTNTCQPDNRTSSCQPDNRTNSCKSDNRTNTCQPDNRTNSCQPDNRTDSCKSDNRTNCGKPETHVVSCCHGNMTNSSSSSNAEMTVSGDMNTNIKDNNVLKFSCDGFDVGSSDCCILSTMELDTVFLIEGQKVFANRSILCSKSEIFAAMLDGHYSEATLSEIPILDCPKLAFEVVIHHLHGCTPSVCAIMRDLYSAEASVEYALLCIAVLNEAHKYMLQDLYSIYMKCLFARYILPESAFSVFQYAVLHRNDRLMKACVSCVFHDSQCCVAAVKSCGEFLSSHYAELFLNTLTDIMLE